MTARLSSAAAAAVAFMAASAANSGAQTLGSGPAQIINLRTAPNLGLPPMPDIEFDSSTSKSRSHRRRIICAAERIGAPAPIFVCVNRHRT